MRIKTNSSQSIVITLFKKASINTSEEEEEEGVNDIQQRKDEVILKSEEVDFHFDVRGRTEEIMPLFSGPHWSAIVWDRSVQVMCNFLESNVKEFAHKQIVELGCGLGVPGIVAGVTCDASEVFLTDRGDDLKVLENALKMNQDMLNSCTKCNFRSVPFDWAQEAPSFLKGDVIIAVECVSADAYGVESLMWLINAFQAVAKRKQTVTVYLCSARRKNDGLEEVLNYINAELAGDEKPLLLQDYCTGDVELYKASLWIGS